MNVTYKVYTELRKAKYGRTKKITLADISAMEEFGKGEIYTSEMLRMMDYKRIKTGQIPDGAKSMIQNKAREGRVGMELIRNFGGNATPFNHGNGGSNVGGNLFGNAGRGGGGGGGNMFSSD